jgi:hypothetical protein
MRPYTPAPDEKLWLHAVLLDERDVAEAYLAEVKGRLIVGLRVKRPWHRYVPRDADRRLAARVAGALRLGGASFHVIPLDRKLRKRLQRTIAPVYARATA